MTAIRRPSRHAQLCPFRWPDLSIIDNTWHRSKYHEILIRRTVSSFVSFFGSVSLFCESLVQQFLTNVIWKYYVFFLSMKLDRLIFKKPCKRLACKCAFSLSFISLCRIFLHRGISALCEKVLAFICITLTRLTLTFRT